MNELNLPASMLPSVQVAIRQAWWTRAADPLTTIRTSAQRLAARVAHGKAGDRSKHSSQKRES